MDEAATGAPCPRYFAYGSNMDSAQMVRRGVPFVSARAAVLRGFRLDFTYPAFERWLGGAADIVPEPTSSVEGVLYGLADESDMPKMDRWEGVHESAYRRTLVEVELPGVRDPVPAWAYAVVEKRAPMAPSPGYIGQMVAGARSHKLSRGYLGMLEGVLGRSRREMRPLLRVLEALAARNGPATVDEVAASARLSRGEALARLSDLSGWGWAEPAPDGGFRLRPDRWADVPKVTGSALDP